MWPSFTKVNWGELRLCQTMNFLLGMYYRIKIITHMKLFTCCYGYSFAKRPDREYVIIDMTTS